MNSFVLLLTKLDEVVDAEDIANKKINWTKHIIRHTYETHPALIYITCISSLTSLILVLQQCSEIQLNMQLYKKKILRPNSIIALWYE